ncbi:RNA-directed DNA polymerase, eukaryota [Tanacetum coccineum]
MGDKRSVEDDVRMISTSIYVTNFPESSNAKELWSVCSQYGNVIDSFIPNIRSKNGKRFGFVRFIKTANVDRLVSNLCTIWIERFKLYANVARFNRQPKNTNKHQHVNVQVKSYVHVTKGLERHPNSYIQAFKTGPSQPVMEDSQPTLVLDDFCFNNADFSLSLVGKVKEFGSLTNLKVLLEEEGFTDISMHYMGGLWVLFQFKSNTNKDNFMSHTSVNSWFSKMHQASNSFKIDERVTWIDIEGVPLCAWSHNTFVRISSKWGSLIRAKEVPGWVPTFIDNNDSDDEYVDAKSDGTQQSANSEADSAVDVIPDTVFEQSEEGEIRSASFKENHKVGKDVAQYDDPLNIYDLLSKKQPTEGHHSEGEPMLDNSSASFKEDADVSACLGHFKSVEPLKTGNKNGARISRKKMLWQYLNHMIARWKGDVIVMGDFNEVRSQEERFCPNISAIILDRYLSDHRPILLRETTFDYGPTPFRFFHYWFECEGFDSFVENTWKEMSISEPNSMLRLLKKLRSLKCQIRSWVKDKKVLAQKLKKDLKSQLAHIDFLLDKGEGTPDILEERSSIMNNVSSLEKNEALELAQKAKVKWSIEGDENSKYFHGIINKQRNNLAIRGIIVDGNWIEDPKVVKNEFLTHFEDRFNTPCDSHFSLDMEFPNKLNAERMTELEQPFTKEEIKGAVWDCGLNKSPGPDGFTFGFYRRYWSVLEADVVDAVSHFFDNGYCPKGGNSSFITLIPKSQGAKQVKDFRPISLIGSLYKIITKILANHLAIVMGNLVNEVQSAFIANRQILDGPFILNEIIRWCKAKKKQTMIFKVDFEKAFDYGSILVNGSPTSEFQFHKGLKQGDPLSPFLFILIMESLHLSFQKVVDAGLFKGVTLNSSVQLSHLFYADDVVFLGQWCDENLNTIVRVLECFFHASGLRINLHKSKLLGLAVENHKVHIAANNLGCMPLSLPFNYLGVKVGARMSSESSWEDVFNKILQRLSKWKMKTLSIRGRLTLIKSVLGSTPTYYLSMFKAPLQVLRKMEAFCSHFFNGINLSDRKASFIKWDNVLVSKEKGGLGVSSFYALNRALNFKWIWRFRTQNSSLWASVIKAIYGNDGMIGNAPLRTTFPRLYSLEDDKSISVAAKLALPSFCSSFRRTPRGGVEQNQLSDLMAFLEGLALPNMLDRWTWSLSGSGEFYVSSIRNLIDSKILRTISSETCWIKFVPIKINILAWRVKLDNLPTRLNLSRRGMGLESIFCPICNLAVESSDHIFFQCSLVKEIYFKIANWWDIDAVVLSSYNDWWSWFSSIRLSAKLKMILEGVFYIAWAVFRGVQEVRLYRATAS